MEGKSSLLTYGRKRVEATWAIPSKTKRDSEYQSQNWPMGGEDFAVESFLS